jgi:hypothetical protein
LTQKVFLLTTWAWEFGKGALILTFLRCRGPPHKSMIKHLFTVLFGVTELWKKFKNSLLVCLIFWSPAYFYVPFSTGCSKIFSPLNLAVTFFLLIKVEHSKGKVLLSRVHCSDGVKISKEIFCLNNMVPPYVIWILS